MSNSKTLKNSKNEIKKELQQVDGALNNLSEIINNINGGIDAISPDAVSLKEIKPGSGVTDTIEVKLQGTDKKYGASLQRTIEKTIEDKYRRINMYSASGIYKRIFISKQNEYMSREFPNLRKSLNLFCTDICYGSYFSNYETTNNRFLIRKNGNIVDDKHEVETIINIINPSTGNKCDISNATFDDLDFEATVLSNRDGYGGIRLIPTSKVLADLYIKYVLKRAKTGCIDGNRTAKITANSLESVEYINDFLTDVGLESEITVNTDLRGLPKHIRTCIPEALTTSDLSTATISENGKTLKDIGGFEENEATNFGNESFLEFAERMLSGKASALAVYRNTYEHMNKRHVYSIGFCSGSFDYETGHRIYSQIADSINLDSISYGLENDSRIKHMGVFDLKTLEGITFEDLYTQDLSSTLDIIKNHAVETATFAMESRLIGNPEAKRPMLRLSPLQRVVKNLILEDKNILVALESEANRAIDEFLESSNLAPGLEAVATFRSQLGAKNEDHKYNIKGTAEALDSGSLKSKIDGSLDQYIRQFSSIKGCTSIILNNSRLIPTLMGTKNNGAYYIERTHAEVEHLLATRSYMSNPTTGGADTAMSLYQMDEERKEGTVGRLVFTDTIRPVIERNINTKFLRDNADIMYTIKELLEESEISRNSKMLAPFTDLGYFNLSKVSYIPPSELILYSNGPGLGSSRFEDAFVPANAYILARESYLSWVLVDGKGACILVVPKGLSELSGEYGGSPLQEVVESTLCTRMSLKQGATDNTRLSKPMMVVNGSENGEAEKIQVIDIQPPDFHIDVDIISKWEEEATGIVGYPASLFTDVSHGGSNPELARKFESVDASIVLDIVLAQDRKAHSSDTLATRLLHYRGGKDYLEYTIEWLAPRPTRSSNNIKGENMENKKTVLESYMSMFDMLFENRPNWEETKPQFVEVLKKKLFTDDKYLSESESLFTEATELHNTVVASNANEE